MKLDHQDTLLLDGVFEKLVRRGDNSIEKGIKEYSKEEVAGSVSKLANLMIEHGVESGNMIKLKTF